MAAIRISPIQPNGDCSKGRMHLIPCKVKYSGEASIKEYFESTIRDVNESLSGESDAKVKEASFRGRPLKGKLIDVPENYEGIVFKEERKPYSDEEERTLIPKSRFDEFLYWNLDNKPTENDNIFRAMKWIQIAQVVHGNQTLEDQESVPEPTPTDR
eukprot:gene9366-17071_t